MSGGSGQGGSPSGTMGNIDPAQIAKMQSFMQDHTQAASNAQPAPQGNPGTMQMTPPSPLDRILGAPQAQQGEAAPAGNPMAQVATNKVGQGMAAGLGAGDMAAANARASGAALPGSGADALAGMMQGMGDKQRADMQKKIDMLKMMAGGG